MRFNSCIFKDPSFLPYLPHVCIRFAEFFLRHWTIPFSFYANANDPMRRVNWMRWRKDLQNKIELVSACVLSIGHSIAGLLLAIHIDSHKPLVFFCFLSRLVFSALFYFVSVRHRCNFNTVLKIVCGFFSTRRDQMRFYDFNLDPFFSSCLCCLLTLALAQCEHTFRFGRLCCWPPLMLLRNKIWYINIISNALKKLKWFLQSFNIDHLFIMCVWNTRCYEPNTLTHISCAFANFQIKNIK